MKREKIDLLIEPLEERIAPGAVGEHEHGNNGWGNGEDESPGQSGEHQPKFDDPNTGPSPSNSPASADGDR